jgi:ADP-ribose pyrophosphatase
MSLISTVLLHQGPIIRLHQDTIEYPDGSTGELDIVRHPGASAIVPLLDDPTAFDPRVLLIRQFRHAAGGWIWEVPAGRLDAGEKEYPERAAARELTEETGYTATHLERLTSIVTTPGFSDEIIHVFLATGLTPGLHHREPDEFMELHEVRWSEAMRMVRSGGIRDAKTLVGLMLVDGRR